MGAAGVEKPDDGRTAQTVGDRVVQAEEAAACTASGAEIVTDAAAASTASGMASGAGNATRTAPTMDVSLECGSGSTQPIAKRPRNATIHGEEASCAAAGAAQEQLLHAAQAAITAASPAAAAGATVAGDTASVGASASTATRTEHQPLPSTIPHSAGMSISHQPSGADMLSMANADAPSMGSAHAEGMLMSPSQFGVARSPVRFGQGDAATVASPRALATLKRLLELSAEQPASTKAMAHVQGGWGSNHLGNQRTPPKPIADEKVADSLRQEIATLKEKMGEVMVKKLKQESKAKAAPILSLAILMSKSATPATVSIRSSRSVAVLKDALQDAAGLATADQRIYFGGTELQGKKLLSSYKIKSGSTLILEPMNSSDEDMSSEDDDVIGADEDVAELAGDLRGCVLCHAGEPKN